MGQYLQQCLEARRSVDVDELANLPLGETVGNPSEKFEFRQLGKLSIRGVNQFTGIKMPTQYRTATWTKIVREVAFIDLAGEYTPALLKKVPSFMAFVTVEDSAVTGVLSEDVSEGGQLRVRPRSASRRTREMLAQPYIDVSPPEHLGAVLHEEMCDTNLAFSVGRREMLLDFTPSPIKPDVMFDARDYQEILHAATKAIFDLKIDLPLDSRLGSDMYDHALAHTVIQN